MTHRERLKLIFAPIRIVRHPLSKCWAGCGIEWPEGTYPPRLLDKDSDETPKKVTVVVPERPHMALIDRLVDEELLGWDDDDHEDDWEDEFPNAPHAFEDWYDKDDKDDKDDEGDWD